MIEPVGPVRFQDKTVRAHPPRVPAAAGKIPAPGHPIAVRHRNRTRLVWRTPGAGRARVAEHLASEEISIGDFVLSGGELPAALVLDAVTRLLPGALGNEASSHNESFSLLERAEKSQTGAPHRALSHGRNVLDFPHYTRPADFRGWKVPEVLIGGNHAEVAKWRQRMALEKTLRNRPDLYQPAEEPV